MPSISGLAGTLMNIGQQARQDELLRREETKQQQDKTLKIFEGLMDNPTIDPSVKEGLFGLYMDTSSTPVEKFNAKKSQKALEQIIGNYYQQQVSQNQQRYQQQVANPPPPISVSLPPPQAPPGAPQLPPITNQFTLPSPGPPPASAAPRPFFDPTRPQEQQAQAMKAQRDAMLNAYPGLGQIPGVPPDLALMQALNKQSIPLPKPAAQQPPSIEELAFQDVLNRGGSPLEAFAKIQELSGKGPKTPDEKKKEDLVFDQLLHKNGGDAVAAYSEFKQIGQEGGTIPPLQRLAEQQALAASGGDPMKAMRLLAQAAPPTQAELTRSEQRDEASEVAKAIAAGIQPPSLTGLYRLGPQVRAQLGKMGYDLTTAQRDWDATKRWLNTLNSASQIRIQQAAEFAFESLDIVDQLNQDLSRKVPRSGRFPVFNKAALAAAKNGAFGAEAQQAATNLDIQIQDLQSELAAVYKGGNSPTDLGLKRASDLLQSNWTEKQLASAVDLARKNLRVRLNSIRTIGPSATSGQTPFSVTPLPGFPGAPPVGTIEDGYEYMGGDPAKQESWKKVQ